MSSFERVRPLVDETIDKLAQTQFRPDPIAGSVYAAQTSIVSSAYKRHGKIIEAALIECLKDSNRYDVWSESSFRISKAADAVIEQLNDAQFESTTLPYGEKSRTVQIDMIAYDFQEKRLGAYEIKRGNGHHDAGKKRSMLRDMQAVHVLLKGYGERFNKPSDQVDSKMIFYYGIRSIPAPYSLIGEELDAHFGFPIRDGVERINAYFKQRLFGILESIEADG